MLRLEQHEKQIFHLLKNNLTSKTKKIKFDSNFFFFWMKNQNLHLKKVEAKF